MTTGAKRRKKKIGVFVQLKPTKTCVRFCALLCAALFGYFRVIMCAFSVLGVIFAPFQLLRSLFVCRILKQATLSTGNTDMGGISGQTTKGRNARGFGPFFKQEQASSEVS